MITQNFTTHTCSNFPIALLNTGLPSLQNSSSVVLVGLDLTIMEMERTRKTVMNILNIFNVDLCLLVDLGVVVD